MIYESFRLQFSVLNRTTKKVIASNSISDVFRSSVVVSGGLQGGVSANRLILVSNLFAPFIQKFHTVKPDTSDEFSSWVKVTPATLIFDRAVRFDNFFVF